VRWPWSRATPTELTAAAGMRATVPVGRIADAALAPSLKRRAQEWQAEAYDHVDTIGPLCWPTAIQGGTALGVRAPLAVAPDLR